MARYTVHTYVTMRIPVSLEAAAPATAALLGREVALGIARRTSGAMEYADDYESKVLVDKLDSRGQRVRSWDIDPTPVPHV